MKEYIGVKIISAEPKIKFNLPKNEEGYKVVYEDGYESWSPKDVFEKSYILNDLEAFQIPEKSYAEHQNRVIEEFLELKIKIGMLTIFISGGLFRTIEPNEQERLKNQKLVMTGYALILKERILNF